MGIWCFIFGHNYESVLIKPHVGRFEKCTICGKIGKKIFSENIKLGDSVT